MDWTENLLSRKNEVNFIYRPHPVENVNSRLLQMQDMYHNFKMISEHSVKQWILASDKIFTWISTSIAEAFFADRPCAIVRPVPIPHLEDMPIYKDAEIIDTLEKFNECIETEFGPSISPDIMRNHYDVDEREASYIRVCDTLETIIKDRSKDYVWDDEELTKYTKRKYIRYAHSIMLEIYFVLLQTALAIQKKTKLSFGTSINNRITNYEMGTAFRNENTASEEEIRHESDRIDHILSRNETRGA